MSQITPFQQFYLGNISPNPCSKHAAKISLFSNDMQFLRNKIKFPALHHLTNPGYVYTHVYNTTHVCSSINCLRTSNKLNYNQFMLTHLSECEYCELLEH